MKCLNRLDMQLYIDNEVSSETKVEIQYHIKECDQCKQLYDESVNEINELKSMLFEIKNEVYPIPLIPEFFIPKTKGDKLSTRFLKYVASIILILGFYSTFLHISHDEKKVETYPHTEFVSLDDSDPNKKWHKNQVEIVIFDKNGNPKESFISEN